VRRSLDAALSDSDSEAHSARDSERPMPQCTPVAVRA
jgi:hypothetical protein